MVYEKDALKCSCSNESPIIESIQGRKLDFLYTSEGAKINGGNVANLFKKIPNAIIRAQTVQNRMDEVKILLEVDKRHYKPEYNNLLKNEFEHTFGANTMVTIEHVDEIARESSGKFRMIKNNVDI